VTLAILAGTLVLVAACFGKSPLVRNVDGAQQRIGRDNNVDARLTIQRTNNLLRGGPTYGGEFTVAIPWPSHL